MGSSCCWLLRISHPQIARARTRGVQFRTETSDRLLWWANNAFHFDPGDVDPLPCILLCVFYCYKVTLLVCTAASAFYWPCVNKDPSVYQEIKVFVEYFVVLLLLRISHSPSLRRVWQIIIWDWRLKWAWAFDFKFPLYGVESPPRACNIVICF